MRNHRVRIESLERRVLLTAYFVSPGGSDGAAGTSAGTAFATLQHAADLVVAGDVVTALPGTYAAGFSIGWNQPQNGTAASRIVFNGVGATITGRNAKTADGIDLEGTSYVTVNGFTITNPTPNNASVAITRAGIRAVEANGVAIMNNSADAMGTWGIFTGFTDDITISGNTTSNSVAQHGIYVSNSSQRPVITGNTVFGNHDCGIQINADLSQGGSGITFGALIEGNIIHDNGAGGGAAINLDGVQSSRIQNNLLYNNHSSGISLFQIDGATGSKNNLVVNNTMLMALDARWDVNINTGSTGNIVYNNILFNASTHGSIAIAADSLAGFVSDYNVVVNLMSNDGGNNAFLTLSQWRTQTGQDAHSVISTPGAVFVGSSDYHLKAGSPALDAGTSLASPNQPPAEDLEGNARPQGVAFDVGAYELVAPSQNTINGTASNDAIGLARNVDGTHIDWSIGTTVGKVLINDPGGLTINGGGGSDVITLGNGSGNPLPNRIHLNGTFTINGLAVGNALAGTNLDVGQSTVYVSYVAGSSPAGVIGQALKIGYNGGSWNGLATGSAGAITSAAAAAGAVNAFGVGYADSGDGVVLGQPINTVEIRFTVMGDANLDRVVNVTDALLMTRNWNASGAVGWDRGDFNFDGVVNLGDAGLLQKNWNSTATGSVSAAAVNGAEPSGAAGSSDVFSQTQRHSRGMRRT
jgi:parallel beta-helix repeat protein